MEPPPIDYDENFTTLEAAAVKHQLDQMTDEQLER